MTALDLPRGDARSGAVRSALVASLGPSAMFMIVACVNWAPLALGSNRLLPWAVNALAAGSALLLAACHAHFAGRDLRARLAPAAVPLLLVASVMAWIAAQALVPLPDPLAHSLWRQAASLSQLDATGGLSVNPRETLLGLMRLATATAICVAAMLLARDARRARLLVDLFLAAAVLYALYGLFRLSFAPDKVLWFDAQPGAYLAGPFLGRNQAATYFGLASIAALAMLLDGFRRLSRPQTASSLRGQAGHVLALLPGALGGRLAMFLLLLSALLLTGSRAGIASSGAGLAALAVLAGVRRGRPAGSGHGARLNLLLAGTLLTVAAISLEVAGGRLTERLLADGLAPGARLEVYRMTLRAIADHAWLGSGYGTFQDIFPLYRADAGPAYLTWDKAHNDYLEVILGLGIPAAGLFLGALAIAGATTVRGVMRRRRGQVFPAIAAAATVQVGLHSLLDFSLQIQAISLAFAILLGVGLAQSVSSRPHCQPGRRPAQ